MYSINMSNVPGVLPGVHLSTAVYSFSRSASVTFLLHLTMHSNSLELGPNSQALILFLCIIHLKQVYFNIHVNVAACDGMHVYNVNTQLKNEVLHAIYISNRACVIN